MKIKIIISNETLQKKINNKLLIKNNSYYNKMNNKNKFNKLNSNKIHKLDLKKQREIRTTN